MQVNNKKILITPLDWGLGHTTRCIPIVKALQSKGAKIILAVNDIQKSLLIKELTDVEYIHFKGYDIQYPTTDNLALSMLLQSPKIIHRIKKEHKEIEQLVRQKNIDLVISDNRFGAYSKKVPSVYITHQINIQAPLGIEHLLYKIHRNYINKFSQCWIPDYKDINLSLAGELSHNNTVETDHYIGLLSRFTAPITTANVEYKYIAIISGPEPQRTTFEEKITALFLNQPYKCAIVRGKPQEKQCLKKENIDIFSHLDTNDFKALLEVSEHIICRPGYSSIMDLAQLQKKVFFVPTKGQTEQEYLALFHYKKNKIGFSFQDEMILNPKYFGLLPFATNSSLTDKLSRVIELL